MEVPEIYDGTVQIKAAVREPGDRAKIAVISTERDVDPVGACVGMKGSRVQAIIRELRGERIDIIEWSEDPAVFAANALSPAKVSKVEINSFEEKKLTVTVPEDQLSLAIGKKGQNVRLAAKLVGWHIDIRSAEEAARAAAAQLEAVMAGGEATLTDIRESLALDQITAERLKDRGIETIEQLSGITVDELVDAIDVSFDQATEILERAHRLLAQKHAREARQAQEAEAATEESVAQEEFFAEAEADEIAEQEGQTAVATAPETPIEIEQQEEPGSAEVAALSISTDLGPVGGEEVEVEEIIAEEEEVAPTPVESTEVSEGETIEAQPFIAYDEAVEASERPLEFTRAEESSDGGEAPEVSPSEAAEAESGQAETNELPPEAFGEPGASEANTDVSEGDEDQAVKDE
jgi:N utilization substance protein A